MDKVRTWRVEPKKYSQRPGFRCKITELMEEVVIENSEDIPASDAAVNDPAGDWEDVEFDVASLSTKRIRKQRNDSVYLFYFILDKQWITTLIYRLKWWIGLKAFASNILTNYSDTKDLETLKGLLYAQIVELLKD
jgi:hypothetical protein